MIHNINFTSELKVFEVLFGALQNAHAQYRNVMRRVSEWLWSSGDFQYKFGLGEVAITLANSTQLRAEYAERSWDYELPDHLEQALEDDYVQNSHLYSEKTFKYIHMLSTWE